MVLAWAEGSWRVRLRPEGRGYEREKAVLWWRGLGGGRDAPLDAGEGSAESAAGDTDDTAPGDGREEGPGEEPGGLFAAGS